MNYNDYIKDLDKTNNKILYFKRLITRSLLSLILLFSLVISIKLNDNNKEVINKYLYSNNLSFNKVNKYFKNKLGSVVPASKTVSLVSTSNDLRNMKYIINGNYGEVNIGAGSSINALSGGIVVYIGEKDNLDNTIIIQGNDGYDIWYANVINSNMKLYDYIEKNAVIGESKDNSLKLKVIKDGKVIKYEDYIK